MLYIQVDDVNIYYEVFSNTPNDLTQKRVLIFLHGGAGLVDMIFSDITNST
ncbi:MAG: hypothetical protein ACK5Z5_05020 [Neisseriaceae bacterium]